LKLLNLQVLGKPETLAEMENIEKQWTDELAVSINNPGYHRLSHVVTSCGVQAAHTCCDGSRWAAMIGQPVGRTMSWGPGQLQSIIASFSKNVDICWLTLW
jgi:hypothetical protein